MVNNLTSASVCRMSSNQTQVNISSTVISFYFNRLSAYCRLFLRNTPLIRRCRLERRILRLTVALKISDNRQICA